MVNNIAVEEDNVEVIEVPAKWITGLTEDQAVLTQKLFIKQIIIGLFRKFVK